MSETLATVAPPVTDATHWTVLPGDTVHYNEAGEVVGITRAGNPPPPVDADDDEDADEPGPRGPSGSDWAIALIVALVVMLAIGWLAYLLGQHDADAAHYTAGYQQGTSDVATHWATALQQAGAQGDQNCTAANGLVTCADASSSAVTNGDPAADQALVLDVPCGNGRDLTLMVSGEDLTPQSLAAWINKAPCATSLHASVVAAP